MAYKELSEVNMSDGLQTIFQYVSEIEVLFFPLILFAIFIIASLGSFFSQKSLTGRGNMKVSLAVASYMTTTVAYVMSLIPGLVNTLALVICLTTSILFTLLLFLSKER